MTTKQWLLRFRNTKAELQSLKEQKEALFDELVSCTAPTDKEALSGTKSSGREMALVKYADISDTIDKRIIELLELRAEINEAIENVSDSVLRTILYERYINLKTWYQISAVVHYSDKHIIQVLHPKALRAVKC